MCTLLTTSDLCDIIQDFVSVLSPARKELITFVDGKPSKTWVKRFLRRNHRFALRRAQLIEDKRATALTPETVGEHIGRMKAACERYGIKTPQQIVNLDESGLRCKPSVRLSRRKTLSLRHGKALTTQVRTRKIDHVTIMGVVTASGHAFKPVVVFPGVQAHVRTVRGRRESLHHVLPPCHLFQREPAGVDSSIFYNWAIEFVKKVQQYRQSDENMLLVFDGYGCQKQYRVLKLLKDNRIFVIGLPAHTSSELQPLDKTVFGPFKASAQSILNSSARVTSQLDAFNIVRVISLAYGQSFTMLNIQSDFQKTGIWDWDARAPSAASLSDLPLFTGGCTGYVPTVEEVVTKFEGRARSLLQEVSVEHRGTVRVDTTTGAPLSAKAVFDAYEENMRRKRDAEEQKRIREAEKAEERQRRIDYREKPAELRSLVKLSVSRDPRRDELRKSRARRRLKAIARTADLQRR